MCKRVLGSVARCTCGCNELSWTMCGRVLFWLCAALTVAVRLSVCLLCLLFFVSQANQAVEALMKWRKYITMVLTVHT